MVLMSWKNVSGSLFSYWTNYPDLNPASLGYKLYDLDKFTNVYELAFSCLKRYLSNFIWSTCGFSFPGEAEIPEGEKRKEEKGERWRNVGERESEGGNI